MSVLGRQAIFDAIETGAIVITPFSPEHVGPASVDLTLANTFRVFRKVHQVIEVAEHTAPSPTRSRWPTARRS
jgi:dCTP deaminase